MVEEGSQLIDGGVLNPVPLNLIKPDKGDLVVAVNLNSNVPIRINAEPEENKEKAMYQKMLDVFRTKILKLETKESKLEMFGFFDLMTKSLDMMRDRLTELTIALYKPHIVVNICRDSCGVFEFYRANEIIEEGKKAFKKSLQNFSSTPLPKR